MHREEFQLRARPAMAGRTARGRLTVYLGAIVIAEIGMSLKVRAGDAEAVGQVGQSVRPYRKDLRVLLAPRSRGRGGYSQDAKAIGDRYLQDAIDLRSGERWSCPRRSDSSGRCFSAVLVMECSGVAVRAGGMSICAGPGTSGVRASSLLGRTAAITRRCAFQSRAAAIALRAHRGQSRCVQQRATRDTFVGRRFKIGGEPATSLHR